MANTNPGGLDLNVSPYYDDYDEDKKFVRVLYVPGRAVQGRELTQSQTIQQKQIQRFANYFFKQGSILDGCEQNLDLNMAYVKLQTNYNSSEVDVADFQEVEVLGGSTGLKAYAGIVSDIEGSDPKTLFINYLSAGAVVLTVNTAPVSLSVGNTITFSTGNTGEIRGFYTDPVTDVSKIFVGNVIGTLTTTTANTILSTGGTQTLNVTAVTDKRSSLVFENGEIIFTANTTNRAYANSAATDATQYIVDEGLATEKTYTKGSKVTIGDGVVYLADHFVKHTTQTLILDKYTNNPSYKIGIVPSKTYVDYVDDSTLVDNAAGTPNYQAPGADRLKIDTVLTKLAIGETTDETEFIQLLEVEDGITKKRKIGGVEGKLEEAIAKRTFEESGNYTLTDPKINIREHLQQGTNNGRYTTAEGGNTNLLLVEVDPFTAYVAGFRNEFIVKQNVNLEKGLDTQYEQQVNTQINSGSYVEVKEFVGSWDFMENTEVDLYNTAQQVISNNAFSVATVSGTKIGTAKVKAVEYVSGTVGTADARFNLYIYDIVMNSGEVFQDVRSIYDSATPKRFADIVLSSTGNAVLQEQSFDKSIFKLPYNAIKTIRDQNDNVETGYRFRKEFSVTFTSGVANFTTSDSSETFVGTSTLTTSQKNDNYLVIVNNSGANVETSSLTGTVTVSSSSSVVTGSGTSFTTQLNAGDLIKINGETRKVLSIANATSLTLASNHTAGASANAFIKVLPAGSPIYLSGNGGTGATRSVMVSSPGTIQIDVKENATFTAKVIATMDRASAREMSKILNYQSTTNINPNTHPNGLVGPYSLGRSDVYQLHAIYQAANFSANASSSNTDVTSNYIFDNGQRDNAYEHGTITPKVGVVPTGRLYVVYDNFTHDTTQGVGYLSINSYPIDDTATSNTTISTSNVPKYTSVRTGEVFDLRNCIDFRPIKTANTALNPIDTGVYQIPTGGLHVPTPGSDFTSDLIFYKGRRTKLYLDGKGSLGFNDGSPGYPNPLSPPSLPDTMDIAELTVPPYPSVPSEIDVHLYRNKRYTMKDIGKIEDRVNKLEYYTALNLLEKQANDKVLLDDDGFDRFKNGILVDPFTGSAIADVSSPVYKSAINREEKYATAYANNENQIALKYTTSGSTGVTKTTGNKLFLSYTQETFIDQPYASQALNLAQNLTYAWVGDLQVIPRTDNWLDPIRDLANNIVIDASGESDNWKKLDDAWNTEVAPINRHWIGLTEITRQVGSDDTDIHIGTNISRQVRTINTQAEFIEKSEFNASIQEKNTSVDRSIDVSVAHEMRSRDFIFKATGMKPGSSLYAFIDGIDVTSSCKQIRLTTGTSLQTLSDQFDNDGRIKASALSTYYTVVSDGSLRVEENFEVLGIIRIPANKFKIGSRELKLTDSSTNSDSATTTVAKESILAVGISQNKTATVIETRPSSISLDAANVRASAGRQTSSLIDSASLGFRRGDTVSPLLQGPRRPDPLTQSFYVDEAFYPDGAFITSLDLYFKTKSTNNNVGVTVEVREMENGFPTKKVIGGERVRVKSSGITTSATAASATTFTFENPIYLLPGSEYCFTVKPDGNSSEFELWTAEVGAIDVTNTDKSVRIDKNNALVEGVLFTVSNDYTWAVKLNLDLKFKMRVAAFTKGSTATAIFENVGISNALTYSAFQSIVEDLIPSRTSINYSIKLADSNYDVTDFFSIKNLERVILGNQKQIANTTNETAESIKSVTLKAELSTESKYISPYIDLTRGNIALEDYVINNSTSTSVTGTVTYSSGSNIVSGSGTLFSTEIDAGQYVKFGDSQYRLVANVVNATYMTVSTNFTVSNGTSQTITIENEENPEGPYVSESRYITRRVALNDGFEASDLVVYLDTNRPAGTDIKVYYKVLNENDTDTFDDKFYQEMTLSGTKIFTQNSKLYTEEKYIVPTSIKTGGSELLNGTVNIASSSVVSGTSTRFIEELRIGDTIAVGASRIERVVSNIVNNTYLTVESAFSTTANTQDIFKVLNNTIQYTTPDARAYTGFKYFSIKVVFISDNDAYSSRIKNLRAIALA